MRIEDNNRVCPIITVRESIQVEKIGNLSTLEIVEIGKRTDKPVSVENKKGHIVTDWEIGEDKIAITHRDKPFYY